MAEEAFLLGLSQLGATFAGFVAIFLAFVRQDGSFSSADRLRIRALIYTSLLVVFAGLAPVMMFYVVGAAEAWRAAGALMLLIGILITADIARSHLAMSRDDLREIVLLHATVTYALSFAALLLAAAVAVGVGPAHVLYIAASMLTLANVSITFVTLAFKNLF